MISARRVRNHVVKAVAAVVMLVSRPMTAAELPADAWEAIQYHPISAVLDLSNVPIAEAGDRETKSEASEGKSTVKAAPKDADPRADLVPGLILPRGSPELEEIYREILAAQIHLHFGVAEFGNTQAFEHAETLIDQASSELRNQDFPVDSPSERQRAGLLVVAEHLQRELSELQHDAANTLAGRFPLIRAFGLQLNEAEEEHVAAYFSPQAARRHAVYDALLKISKTAPSDAVLVFVLPQGDVDAGSATFTDLADSQARIAFRTVSNANLISGSLRKSLPKTPAWDAPDGEFDPLCRQILKDLGSETPQALMLILVRESIPNTRDGYWVQAQQRSYGVKALKDAEDDADSLEADKIRFSESFTRDRSATKTIVLCGVILCGGLAIGLFLWWSQGRMAPTAGWPVRLAIPLAGFVVGAVLHPLIVLAMSSGMPDARSPVWSSIWWPCVTGALTLILPSGVMRLGFGTAGKYLPSLSCHGMWGIAFVPVALGVAAGWIASASSVFGIACVPPVAAMAFAGALLLYCFGRSTDMTDEFPLAFTPVVLALALPFGAGAFLGSGPILVTVGLAMAAGLLLYFWRRRLRPDKSDTTSKIVPKESSSPELARVPRTLDELRLALQKPAYQPPETPAFHAVIEAAQAEKTVWLGLAGPSAAGKSAAAEFLVHELCARRPEMRVLVGRCAEKSPAYQPFREALAEMGVPNQLLTARSQAGGMNDLFDRLADRFIPFWEFFSGYRDRVEEDHDDEAVAPVELLSAVAKAIHTAAQDSGLVLFIDDLQWIDEWSKQMLEHLREEFPPDGEMSCVVLLAAREEKSLESYELGENLFVLSPPDMRRQRVILEQSLGIEAASAKRIVEAIGAIGQEPGGMFWLFRSVHELAEKRALSPTSRGFALRKQYLRGGHLPIPDSMRQALVEHFRESKEHRPVLECAALLGEKFRVRDLADCLRMDRLDLLHVLRTLEEEHQIVHDLPADPECYAFSSVFMLRIIRAELHLGSGETWNPRPTKIAQEWHARIAHVLEQREPRTNQLVNDLALHFSAAGPGYESQAVDFCLAAARLAVRKHHSREAVDWLYRARHAARSGRISIAAERMAEFTDLLPPSPVADPPATSQNGAPELMPSIAVH